MSFLESNPVTDATTIDSRWNGFYIVSSMAALILGGLFLTAMISLITTSLLPGFKNGLTPFENNWLVILFKLHAGVNGIQSNLLYQLNPLDITILALVGTLYLGLYFALRRTSRIWSLIALAQPFLGLALFIATKTAGRSTVMGATLVISFVMLRSLVFGRETAYLGILASILLLVSDLSVGITHSDIIAIITAIGYVLLMAWFFFVTRRLFQLGQGAIKAEVNLKT